MRCSFIFYFFVEGSEFIVKKILTHTENDLWLTKVGSRVANAIRAYQQRTGKSQLQVAKELEVDRGQITRYLSGAQLPSLLTLRSMADLFQLPVGFFFDGDATYPADCDD